MQQLRRPLRILLIIFLLILWFYPAKPLVDTFQSVHQSKIKTISQIKTVKLVQVSDIIQTVAPTLKPTLSVGSSCGDNSYASYIYNHESTCNTQAQNPAGCLGIGQACPGSKLLAVCPNLDYTCENNFFTSYAISAYGSWENAYNHEVQMGWW